MYERLWQTALVDHCNKKLNLWKIFAGHSGDWFDVKAASICTTKVWDALKSFHFDQFENYVGSLHYKSVAGHLK